MADPIVTVTITRSAGTDGALLVLIDTTEHFQPGSRPIRVLLNDADVFADTPYLHPEDDQLREAGEVTIDVTAEQVAYLDPRSARLEYLRGEIREQRISYGELVELQSLAPFIDRGDVELLEWAGVPEHGTTPVWLAEGDGDVIVINDVNDMRDNFEDARELGAVPADMGFEDYCDGWTHADMPAHLTGDDAQEWAAQQL